MPRVRSGRRSAVREATPAAPPTVLIDTNVLLDAVLRRGGWVSGAVRLLDAAARRELVGLVSVHALATLAYIARKQVGAAAVRTALAELATIVSVAEVGDDDVRYALSLPFDDFEDALHVAAARRASATLIITRDADGFRDSPIPALAPGAALALLFAR